MTSADVFFSSEIRSSYVDACAAVRGGHGTELGTRVFLTDVEVRNECMLMLRRLTKRKVRSLDPISITMLHDHWVTLGVVGLALERKIRPGRRRTPDGPSTAISKQR